MNVQSAPAQANLGKNPSERSVARPGRKNRFAPKTRTGCLTCRARRIKCDEARPSCCRCIKANHACRYAPKEVALFPRRRFQRDVGIIEAINGNADVGYLDSLLPNYGSWEEKYYLDKFLNLTAPWLSKYNDGSFFHILLPQRSWHHPALRHTLVAVAMATVQFRAPLDFTSTKQHHWHHSQALHHLYTASPEDEEVIILTSAMMWLHSNLTFSSHTAMVHLQGLLRMLHEYRIKRRRKGLPAAVIESQLLRLLVFHVDVSKDSSPSAQSQRSEVVNAILSRLRDADYSRRFRTMDEVCDELRLGLTAISYVSRTPTGMEKRELGIESGEIGVSITAPDMRTYFEKWYRAFSTVPDTPHTDLILLECYYIFASLVLQAQQFGTSSSSPSALDDQQTTDRLVYMLDRLEEIEALSLPQIPPGRDPALPMSIIPTQVIVLTRNAAIRKRAYAYLRRLKRVEGLWSTDMAADMIEAIHPPEPWLGSAAAYNSVSTLPSPTSNDLDAWQSLLPPNSTQQAQVSCADTVEEGYTTATSNWGSEHNSTSGHTSPSWNGSHSNSSHGGTPDWKRDARVMRPDHKQSRPTHGGRLDEDHKAELLEGGMLIDQMMQEQTTWTLTSIRGTYDRVSAR